MLLTIQVPDVRRCNHQFAFCNRRFVDVIANSNVIASSPRSVRIRRCNSHRQVTTYWRWMRCQKDNSTQFDGKKFQFRKRKLQINYFWIFKKFKMVFTEKSPFPCFFFNSTIFSRFWLPHTTLRWAIFIEFFHDGNVFLTWTMFLGCFQHDVDV